MVKRKYIDILLSISFIILAALLFGSADSGSKAVSKASTDSETMYVNFLAIMLGLAGIAELFMSAISNPSVIKFTKNPKRFFTLILSLIGYVWIMQYIGFIISTLVFIPAIMRFMGYTRFFMSLVISSGITLFIYLLFEKGFDILLPGINIFLRS
jgi:hypothetical protein